MMIKRKRTYIHPPLRYSRAAACGRRVISIITPIMIMLQEAMTESKAFFVVVVGGGGREGS